MKIEVEPEVMAALERIGSATGETVEALVARILPAALERYQATSLAELPGDAAESPEA